MSDLRVTSTEHGPDNAGTSQRSQFGAEARQGPALGAPRSMPRLGVDWPVLLLVAAFGTLPAMHNFWAPLNTLDEAYLLVYPEQMLLGRMPHEDFFTVYGPGGYALLTGVYWLFEPSVMLERTVGLMYHLGIATGVASLARPYGRIISAMAGAASAVLLLPVGLGAYAWFGGLALAVWSLALLVAPRGRAVVTAAGFFGGLVMAWRVEMLVLVLAAWPLLWRRALVGPYLAGLAVGLAPMAAFVAFTGSALLENVFLSRLALNAQLRPTSVPVGVWLVLAILVVCTVSLVAIASRGSTRTALITAHAALAVLLLPQSLQRADTSHVLYAMCVTLPLALASLVHSGRSRSGGSPEHPAKFRAFLALALMVLVVLTTMSILAIAASQVSPLTHRGRTTLVQHEDASGVAAQLELITDNVPEGSRIFIGATDMSVPTLTHFELYHLLPEYRSLAYYLELPPGVAERVGSPLVDDIRRADWLVLSHMPDALRRDLFPYIGGAGSNDANAIVAAQFCPVDSVSGVLTLYRRCASSSRSES